MHELSLCQGLLRQVEAIAAEHDQSRVRRITLRIGPLAGVEPQLLQQAFEIARNGSSAAEAQLQIDSAPLCIHCPGCHADHPAELPRLSCPHCGSEQTTLISGDELLLVSVSFFEE